MVMTQPAELEPQTAVAPVRLDAHLAFLLGDLSGGGLQRIVTILARELAERGARIEILVCAANGEFQADLPPSVAVIELRKGNALAARFAALRADPTAIPALLRPLFSRKHGSRSIPYLPSLVDYLRHARPDTLFAATPNLNIEAVLARRLARVETRIVLSERSHFSSGKPRKDWRRRHLSPVMRRTYLQADAIVAVSGGVADDLMRSVGIPRAAITILHNPTLTPDLAARRAEPVEHPWFAPGGPPVLLSVGRLAHQKDHPTLLRAFARLRQRRPARLMIAGKGSPKHIDRVYQLAAELGVRGDVEVLGFLHNPLPYMARATLFVLSSRFEGFANVVLEALACGTPVVSTDCPSGPREILDDGAFGELVPVGDDGALAEAIERTLDHPPDPRRLRARAAVFDYDEAIGRYQAVLLGPAHATRRGLPAPDEPTGARA